MAEDPSLVTCPGCEGWGRTWKGTGWTMMTCPICQGEGQVDALPPEPPLWLVALIVLLVLGLAFFGLLAVDVLGGGNL